MIDAAKQATPDNVRCILGDVLTEPLAGTLHHLPLDEALPVLARAVRPGGVLAAVALPRPDLLRELPVELAAVIGHRLFGIVFRILRARGHGSWYAVEAATHDVMPVVLDPPLTTRQVRARVATILPGARVRRLVFWRYSLVWRKPA
jgi:SAM-dependent methyltransferase